MAPACMLKTSRGSLSNHVGINGILMWEERNHLMRQILFLMMRLWGYPHLFPSCSRNPLLKMGPFFCLQQEIKITGVTIFVNPYSEPDEEEERAKEEEKKAADADDVGPSPDFSIFGCFVG